MYVCVRVVIIIPCLCTPCIQWFALHTIRIKITKRGFVLCLDSWQIQQGSFCPPYLCTPCLKWFAIHTIRFKTLKTGVSVQNKGGVVMYMYVCVHVIIIAIIIVIIIVVAFSKGPFCPPSCLNSYQIQQGSFFLPLPLYPLYILVCITHNKDRTAFLRSYVPTFLVFLHSLCM